MHVFSLQEMIYYNKHGKLTEKQVELTHFMDNFTKKNLKKQLPINPF